MKFVSSEILAYCESHSNKDSELLKELIEHTYATETAPQMISGSHVGNFLQSLIKMTKSKNILEIGMFTGYSALKMAEVIPKDGIVHTCELMEQHVQTASSFFNRSSHKDKISIFKGPATETLEQLKINFYDFVFIDADKQNYCEYYQKAIKLLKPGGVIVLDNMLWSGGVIDPKDIDSQALADTAEYINSDDRVYNFLAPIRDGLMVCIKNE
ncbi:MAG: methyltransferase [Candidatus Marinimicrobia bacterium]|nr:methyltransferase [Candidatus Neomarinimicrobiota bacterium]|tara:strand:- start:1844 stop:2482 length:639 start_codon:yes stop_codon:yes gene_type:complete